MAATHHQSSAALAARQRLADRLRELRLDAGLSGRDVAARTGWQPSKVSRLETAKTAPADADIRAWCAACEADELAPDLIAASRAAASMYMEWRRLQRAGLKNLQNSYVPAYARTKEFRVYSSTVVPGMLQTPDYALAMLRSVAAFHGGVDDVEAAVQARMERSEMVRNGGSRLVVVLEESVLRHVLGGAEVMAAQLGALLSAMSAPAVSLGIIPAGALRQDLWTLETFTLLDAERVSVELLTAAVTVTAPSEIAQYRRAFAVMAEHAVYGAPARELVAGAIQSLSQLP
ncbi:helix-turn-helix domain-containing protein [Streptomyces albidoflavus]